MRKRSVFFDNFSSEFSIVSLAHPRRQGCLPYVRTRRVGVFGRRRIRRRRRYVGRVGFGDLSTIKNPHAVVVLPDILDTSLKTHTPKTFSQKLVSASQRSAGTSTEQDSSIFSGSIPSHYVSGWVEARDIGRRDTTTRKEVLKGFSHMLRVFFPPKIFCVGRAFWNIVLYTIFPRPELGAP